MAIAELRRHGLSVHPAPEDAPGNDRLVDQNGFQHWLSNLQLTCTQLPAAEWPGAVEYHFAQYFAARTEPPTPELSETELLAQVRTRLQRRDTSGKVPLSYARPAFDGLVAELNRDLPTTVRTMPDGDLVGRDVEFLYQVGQRNTDAEPFDIQRLQYDIAAITGESFFTASKALNMPHVIQTTLGGSAPFGVIFGVPHRHLLLLHAVGADTDVAVGRLATATVNQTDNAPGGVVSADTYYWYGGLTHRITRIDLHAKSIEILVDGAFAEAMGRA
ncbi:hypothetical protein [Mycobacterium sp. OTB74]|uniref:hypothetical protein n=1 Tax=Mycobacterium sp. OTB74 TaxID=1853452 RepID=UPI002475F84E|nr:hypothetical protein [Mycobacterium sp. OTB74]